MTPIPRLDYSKPPLGYLVHDLNDDGWWWRVDEPEDGCTSPYETEAEAVAAAWVHYKAHNDPPGIEVDGGAFYPQGYTGYLQCDGSDARAAAWTWYDRRLAIAAGFDALGSDPWPWPECLSWSDKQASTAELHLGSALPPDGGPTRG